MQSGDSLKVMFYWCFWQADSNLLAGRLVFPAPFRSKVYQCIRFWCELATIDWDILHNPLLHYTGSQQVPIFAATFDSSSLRTRCGLEMGQRTSEI